MWERTINTLPSTIDMMSIGIRSMLERGIGPRTPPLVIMCNPNGAYTASVAKPERIIPMMNPFRVMYLLLEPTV